MTIKELFAVMKADSFVRILKGNELIHAGFLGTILCRGYEHGNITGEEKVKEVSTGLDIFHNDYKAKELRGPLLPVETPGYNFKDMTEKVYYKIIIEKD